MEPLRILFPLLSLVAHFPGIFRYRHRAAIIPHDIAHTANIVTPVGNQVHFTAMHAILPLSNQTQCRTFCKCAASFQEVSPLGDHAHDESHHRAFSDVLCISYSCVPPEASQRV